MTYLPVALTIAGTDPSGGAGIMADLKSFQARGVYGMAVVTSLVAQNTRGVQLIEHVSPQMLKAQLESVFSDISPQAVKTGMLATTKIMEMIQPYLKQLDCPYVLDPVMVATSGDALIDTSARDYLKTNLLPLATIITPNLPEAEEIVGFSIKDQEDMQKAGRLILNQLLSKEDTSKVVPKISSSQRMKNLSGKVHEFKLAIPMVLAVPLLQLSLLSLQKGKASIKQLIRPRLLSQELSKMPLNLGMVLVLLTIQLIKIKKTLSFPIYWE